MTLDQLASGAGLVAGLAKEINVALGERRVKTIDIGGGLPVDFAQEGRGQYTFLEYADALRRAAPALFDGTSFDRVITEFGRAYYANLISLARGVCPRRGDQVIAISHIGSDLLLRNCYCPTKFHNRVELYSSKGSLEGGFEQKEEEGGDMAGTRHNIAGPLCGETSSPATFTLTVPSNVEISCVCLTRERIQSACSRDTAADRPAPCTDTCAKVKRDSCA